ncbi:MAG: Lrp/AsnC ligand binding domain-containing protein [Aigarchaeota archaeon]|nr:Lrp/AsnC ligand binding domain-containing protein [Aigarchaeota archaeon]MDW8093232.1 Lrp/AsnC ligand binding domain-containing protein [Nitrososphaerota archaeon]
MKAFVLGTVGARSELLNCLDAVRRSNLVSEAYLIFGIHDIICKVEFERLQQLNGLLDVLTQNGVVDSNTMIVNSEGLSFEREGGYKRKKCAYTFIKIRRPAAPRLWETFLKSVDTIAEAHEVYGMYDVVVGVSEDAKHDFFNRYFRRLWLLTDINMTNTHTFFTVDL